MRSSSTTAIVLALATSTLDTDALSFHSNKISGSSSSSFTSHGYFPRHDATSSVPRSRRDTMRMYEPSDPLSKHGDGGVWSALANTERWISDTLAEQSVGGSNPYVRKEVSYVCETTEAPVMAVAHVFRRVREARELGESHSKVEEAIVVDRGPDYVPGTLRQTQVVVIPWCEHFTSYYGFDAAFQAINAARRAARDYVTDVSLEKLEMDTNGNRIDRDWVVSISLASLHPDFGAKTMAEKVAKLESEEEAGEVDVNLEEYKKRRVLARQSPYPTLVLEVKALPPPEFDDPMQGSSDSSTGPDVPGQSEAEKAGGASKTDLKKLEALFGLSPATGRASTEEESEDSFYDSIGQVPGIEEVSIENTIVAAQGWITQNDPLYDHKNSIFTVADAMHVDAAYEVVFTNIAAQKEALSSSPSSEESNVKKDGKEYKVSNLSYIMMPHFLSSSATSMEKFLTEMAKILGTVLRSNEVVSIYMFHPEHVLVERRCPVPTIAIQSYEVESEDEV